MPCSKTAPSKDGMQLRAGQDRNRSHGPATEVVGFHTGRSKGLCSQLLKLLLEGEKKRLHNRRSNPTCPVELAHRKSKLAFNKDCSQVFLLFFFNLFPKKKKKIGILLTGTEGLAIQTS